MADIVKIKNNPNAKVSYKIVCNAVDDQLTCAKLCFFSFVAKILEPYLVAHQMDKPMIPFFYQDLFVLIRKTMQIIAKPKVLSDIYRLFERISLGSVIVRCLPFLGGAPTSVSFFLFVCLSIRSSHTISQQQYIMWSKFLVHV